VAYPPPTLLERILLPFRIIYWRWFWKPVDYDRAPRRWCQRPEDYADPQDEKPRDKNHGHRGQDPRP
jgi:hypothetical protein